MRHAVLNRTYMNSLDSHGTLRARAHQGLTPSRLRIARGVAFAIGISLSIVRPIEVEANNLAITQLKELADYKLTDKQYKCHNEIIYRESRWDYKAVGNLNGSKRVYGLYQMKSESLKGSTPIKQFWMYWHYVAHRYHYTKYDEPNYCKALHHLRTKGWQ